MQISIIIPSYNSSSTIENIFTHLNISDDSIKEIIVVDSSEDAEFKKIEEIINRFKTKINLIHLEQKSSPAVARNRGAIEASGDLLVFIDSDAYPDQNWITTIVEAYDKGFMVGGGSIELPEFQKRNFIATSQYYLQFNEFLPVKNDRVKKFVPSCNIFCDRKLFNEVGGFPEVRASEDVLFGIKANTLSPLWFIPDCKVSHIFGKSWSRFAGNQELLGKYVAIYRKQDNKLLSNKLFQLLLFPFVPVIKFALLFSRIIKSDIKNITRFLITAPVIYIGLIYWAIGFIKGCFSKEVIDV